MRRSFKPTTPAEIVFQVFRCHAMEATQPCFEPAGIRIHILNVVDPADDANAGGNIHRPMDNPQVLTGDPVRRGTVRTENGIGRYHRPQHGFDIRSTRTSQSEIRRLAVSVSQQQNGDLFSPCAALMGRLSALAGFAFELPLALARVAKESLVSLRNAMQLRRFLARWYTQETMTPAKAGGFIDITTLGRFPHARAFDHGLAVRQPALLVPQVGQRRSRQNVKRLATITAAKALHSRASSPTVQTAAATTGTGLFRVLFQLFHNGIPGGRVVQALIHYFALTTAQFRQTRQPVLKYFDFHRPSLHQSNDNHWTQNSFNSFYIQSLFKGGGSSYRHRCVKVDCPGVKHNPSPADGLRFAPPILRILVLSK